MPADLLMALGFALGIVAASCIWIAAIAECVAAVRGEE